MVNGDHPGGSLAGNDSLLASSTISVGLRVSEACGQSSGAAPVSASPATARSSGLIVARSLDALVMVFLPGTHPPSTAWLAIANPRGRHAQDSASITCVRLPRPGRCCASA
jgi:hypothetical protein